jgi:uncharacterized protein YkwD
MLAGVAGATTTPLQSALVVTAMQPQPSQPPQPPQTTPSAANAAPAVAATAVPPTATAVPPAVAATTAVAPQPSRPAERPALSFEARLAHGSEPRTVGGFGSVKGLYEALHRAFGLPLASIMYCTVNTQRADMSKLLGPALEEGDVIYAHVRGPTKAVRRSPCKCLRFITHGCSCDLTGSL